MIRPATIAVAIATALISSSGISSAGDLQSAAAKVFSKQKAHTVSISVTRKKGAKDLTFDAQALSLDGKGLFVTALSAIAPQKKFMSGRKSDPGELTGLSIYADDGTEIDAEVLLKDPDLDIAFIRAKNNDGKASVFGAPVLASAKPGVLEDVLAIQRMSATFQRKASVSLIEIAAVVENPSVLYIATAAIKPGVAVFNLKGELIGIGASKGKMVVVVPAATLLKLADGVPEK